MDAVNKIIMCASVVKNANSTTGYSAILSDDSIDREGEIVGKALLENSLDGYTAALMDHENKVLNHVAKWTNKRMESVDGHSALIAEPKFFLSNPNAKILKGMLDEGAELSVSISAIPTKHEMVKIHDKEYKMYTQGEVLEASFVGVPANKHARAIKNNLLVAKSLNLSVEQSTKSLGEKSPEEKMVDKISNDAPIPANVAEPTAPVEPTGPVKPTEPVPADTTPDAAKSLDMDAVEKKIRDGIKKGISDSPIYKALADQMPEAMEKVAKTKAQEAIEKKMLPVI